MPTYRSLFARREFRALWTSSALTTVASTTSSLALATVVHRQTGSALLSAVAMFGPSLAQVLGATTLMSVADTAPPRRTLTVVGTLTAAALAVQTLPGLPPSARLLVVLGAAYVVAVGSGVRWGLLAEILPADGYALGRSAMNVSVGACQVVGFATGGLLLSVLSTPEVFALAAGVAALAVPVLRFGLVEHPPRRSARAGLRETWRGNRVLLSARSTRTLLIALCVPNGLIVGCEALFVPYAGDRAGLLLAAGAVGMMTGDLVAGRYLTAAGRRRASTPLRILLAGPFLVFAVEPGEALAVAAVALGSAGYAASLAQQEWLVVLTPEALRGQVLGLESSARMTAQGVFAVLAGTLGDLIPPSAAIALLATASLAVSLLLTGPLARVGDRAASPSGAGVGGPYPGLP
ncbi:hypothetical protein [Blastococcus sp. TF02-8]|uniref:hypothetical protein n=1 Tax=Blastococcus sp. TF02-8 TaxID=2250574 RepID=UPI00197AA5BA|nr:hypothetical protein [Blastococcus sp. TF02-8]